MKPQMLTELNMPVSLKSKKGVVSQKEKHLKSIFIILKHNSNGIILMAKS